ncbi:MAG: hypothetical protein VKO00_00280, partial [Cyanobacteriota bacterium]|nr:hypothetical protein [Cyanobacteriota bacterium]
MATLERSGDRVQVVALEHHSQQTSTSLKLAMQLDDIRHSSFSAATKSKMLLDLWIQLYRQPARPKSSDTVLENLRVYHRYYEALAIVENL